MKMESAVEEYRSTLADLVQNSKPHITMLTMLADDYKQFAPQVVEVIEARMKEARSHEKLPAMYLMDSCVKNVKQSNYLALFSKNLVANFVAVFEKVDEKTRMSMWKLRGTWADVFSNELLYALDMKVKGIDPAWPVQAKVPEKTESGAPVLVNPKFMREDILGKDALSDTITQEALMRAQLLAKQKELITLQQKKVEEELRAAKNYLEQEMPELLSNSVLTTSPTVASETAITVAPATAPVHSAPSAAEPRAAPVPPVAPVPPASRDPRLLARQRVASSEPSPPVPPTAPSLPLRPPPQAPEPPTRSLLPPVTTKEATEEAPARSGSSSRRDRDSRDGRRRQESDKGSSRRDRDRHGRRRGHRSRSKERDSKSRSDRRGPRSRSRSKDRSRNRKEGGGWRAKPEEERAQDVCQEDEDSYRDSIMKGRRPRSVQSRHSKDAPPNKVPKLEAALQDETSQEGATDTDYREIKAPMPVTPGTRESNPAWARHKAERPDEFVALNKIEMGLRSPPPKPPAPPKPPSISQEQADISIPPSLDLSRAEHVMSEANEQLQQGKITHAQHQEILKQLGELYRLQQLKSKMSEKGYNGDGVPSPLSDSRRNSSSSVSDTDSRPRPPGPPPRPPAPPPLMGPRPGPVELPIRHRFPEDVRSLRLPYDQDVHYVFEHDPRWNPPVAFRDSSSTKDKEKKFEVLVDEKTYEMPDKGMRKVRIGHSTKEVMVDAEAGELLVDHSVRYRIGEPARKSIFGGQEHVVYCRGPSRRFWIDEHPYELYEDGPPERLQLGRDDLDLRIDSRQNKLLVNGAAVTEFGGPRRAIHLLKSHDDKHVIEFEPPTRKILIDGKPCELNFKGKWPVIVIEGTNHGIRFDGEHRQIKINDQLWELSVDRPLVGRMFGGRPHHMALGGPGHEIIIDGEWHELKWNGPFRHIKVGGKRHKLQLIGKPPEVKILGVVRTDPMQQDCLKTFGTLEEPVEVRERREREEYERQSYRNERPYRGDGRGRGDMGRPFRRGGGGGSGLLPTPAGGSYDHLGGHDGNERQRYDEWREQPYYDHGAPSGRGRGFRGNRGRRGRYEPGPGYSDWGGPGQSFQPRGSGGPRGAGYHPGPGLRYDMPRDNRGGPRGPMRPQGSMQNRFIQPGPWHGRDEPMNNMAGHPGQWGHGPWHEGEYGPPAEPVPPTPPQPPSINTQVDVNDLLSKLTQAGIIGSRPGPGPAPPAPVPAAVPEVQVSAPAGTPRMPEVDDPAELLKDMPDVTGFEVTALRQRYDGIIARLYTGVQCSTCGVRFLATEAERYREHLDWHFRQNRKGVDECKVAQFRQWYYTVEQWVQYEEFGDAEERAQSAIFDAMLSKHGQEPGGGDVISCPAASGNDNDDVCDECGEAFEQFYDDEEEAWHLKDALRFEEKTYHPLCYEDVKARQQAAAAAAERAAAPEPADPEPTIPDMVNNPLAYLQSVFQKTEKAEPAAPTIKLEKTDNPVAMDTSKALPQTSQPVTEISSVPDQPDDVVVHVITPDNRSVAEPAPPPVVVEMSELTQPPQTAAGEDTALAAESPPAAQQEPAVPGPDPPAAAAPVSPAAPEPESGGSTPVQDEND